MRKGWARSCATGDPDVYRGNTRSIQLLKQTPQSALALACNPACTGANPLRTLLNTSDHTTMNLQPLTPASNGTPGDMRMFPPWHFAMMNDSRRNKGIESAIRDANVKGKLVFEIGTGAGLTAMLFAKYGAAKVITCELDAQLYAIAVRTIQKNGLAGGIQVLQGSSTDLIKAKAVPKDPDIVFTETLDCGVVGEGYTAIANDIAEIAGKSTMVMPSRVEQYGYMLESQELRNQNHVDYYDDLDLTEINRYATEAYFPVRLGNFASRSLSMSSLVREYDYTQESNLAHYVTFDSYAEGVCHGIASYFHAYYGQHVVSNELRDRVHWHQAVHHLNEPLPIKAGQKYVFHFSQSGRFSPLQPKRRHS
ncbi:hypothetical protein [Variovorax sp. GT1P44]|uniref:hypothetical protein n=1 Tax=Variovorax sp. GT1P44 TaxID=3443742 RepID=UPI003F46FAF9